MRRLERGLAVLSIGFKKRGSPIIFPDHPKTTAKQRRQRKAAVRMAMDGMDYES